MTEDERHLIECAFEVADMERAKQFGPAQKVWEGAYAELLAACDRIGDEHDGRLVIEETPAPAIVLPNGEVKPVSAVFLETILHVVAAHYTERMILGDGKLPAGLFVVRRTVRSLLSDLYAYRAKGYEEGQTLRESP